MSNSNAVKRGRGRPKKNPAPTPAPTPVQAPKAPAPKTAPAQKRTYQHRNREQFTLHFRYKIGNDWRNHRGSFWTIAPRKPYSQDQIDEMIDKYMNKWFDAMEVSSITIEVNEDSIQHTQMSIPYGTTLHGVKMFDANPMAYAGDRRFKNWKFNPESTENCVIEFLLSEFKDKKGTKKYTKEKILQVMGRTADDVEQNGCDEDDIRKICENLRISFYAFDLKNALVDSFVVPEAERNHHLSSLMFIKANGHCYPISDPAVRQSLHNEIAGNSFGRKETQVEEETKPEQKAFVVFDAPNPKLIDELFEKYENKDIYLTYNDDLKLLHQEIINKHKIAGVLKSHKETCNYLGFPEQKIRIFANQEFHDCYKIAQAFGYVYHNESISMMIKKRSEEQLKDWKHSELTADMCRRMKHLPWKLRPVNYYNKHMHEEFYDEPQHFAISDMSKAFPTALINSTYDYPVFSKYDSITKYDGKPIKSGFYFVSTSNSFPLQGNGWYFASLVQYALDEKKIQPYDISYQYIPKTTLPKDYFKKFVEDTWNLPLDDKLKKNILLRFIGMMYKDPVVKTEKTLTTTNFEEACYYYYKYTGVRIDSVEQDGQTLYVVHYVETKFIEQIDLPIHLAMMANYRVNLHKLYKEMMDTEDPTLLAIKTDCIVVHKGKQVVREGVFGGVKKDKFPKLKREIRMFWDGRRHLTEYKQWATLYVENEREIKDWVGLIRENRNLLGENFDNWKLGKSYMINCGGGYGKSWYLTQLMEYLQKNDIKFKAAAYTHTAKKKLVCNDKVVGMTLRKLFWSAKYREQLKLQGVKVLILDEISMIPGHIWKRIDELKKIGIQIIGCGDFNQLPPVEGDWGNANYYDMDIVKSIFNCKEYKFMQYHRGDTKLKDVLDTFLNKNKLRRKDFGKNTECEVNLCFTNEKRKAINAYWMNKHKAVIELEAAANKYSQKMRIYPGLPVICYTNWKGSFPCVSGEEKDKVKIFNNEWFSVEKIEKENIIIKDDDFSISIPTSIFTKMFVPRYAMTIHKCQGMTLETEYCIHERNNLNKELMYVAISRATTLSHINFSD